MAPRNMPSLKTKIEKCGVCGCVLHRTGGYAKPTVEGRSHATRHHLVPERFFGRSTNRRGDIRDRIFAECPWGLEGKSEVFCFECHEELLHNPVFRPEDIADLARLAARRGLNESQKGIDRSKIGGRIRLLNEVLAAGLKTLLRE